MTSLAPGRSRADGWALERHLGWFDLDVLEMDEDDLDYRCRAREPISAFCAELQSVSVCR